MMEMMAAFGGGTVMFGAFGWLWTIVWTINSFLILLILVEILKKYNKR